MWEALPFTHPSLGQNTLAQLCNIVSHPTPRTLHFTLHFCPALKSPHFCPADFSAPDIMNLEFYTCPDKNSCRTDYGWTLLLGHQDTPL